MASIIEQKISGFAALLPAVKAASLEQYQEVYEQNRHRIYSLAFWITDNELEAEELMKNSLYRAFVHGPAPTPEAIDAAFIAEVRELMPIGILSLDQPTCTEIVNARSNVLRAHLERAVVQLPATEKLIFLMHDVESYTHERTARTLGITTDESQVGLHQARLRLRQLLAEMR